MPHLRASFAPAARLVSKYQERRRRTPSITWRDLPEIRGTEQATGVVLRVMRDLGFAGRLWSMRKQYHFWPGDQGLDAWDVDRLIDLSRNLPAIAVDPGSIPEVDTAYWSTEPDEGLSVRDVIQHFMLIQEVDFAYPIILGPDGRVMDGMHRIARSLIDGRSSIEAVQFKALPDPDFRNCRPEDLPY